MKKRPSIRARLRYAFDNSFARGTMSVTWWLAGFVILVAVAFGAFTAITGIGDAKTGPLGFVDSAWQTLGNFGLADSSAGWPQRLLIMAQLIVGIFIGCAVFILAWNAVNNKLDQLRKGRSRVLETNHTVILNWSPAIFDVISELVVANATRRRPRIAILADKDQQEMVDAIKEKVPTLGNTRIICRTGDPTDVDDLAIVAQTDSRSVVILSPEDDDPDSHVIKSVLALVNDPKRREQPYRIVAEIRDPNNLDVARVVGGDELQVVLADSLLARLIVQSSRQAGLSLVYAEMLDFEGCEFYITEQPELTGKTFDDAVLAYPQCIPIGLVGTAGQVRVNPPGETPIRQGDRLVIIAEDDATIHIDPSQASFDRAAIRERRTTPTGPERTLIIGWNRRGPMIVRELSSFSAPGSKVTIAADTPDIEDDVAGLGTPSANVEVELRRINTVDRAALESLDIPSYQHVLVIGYSDLLPAQSADTKTLITLLNLRKIIEASGCTGNVISEMIDVRNRALAEATRADDFVVSNRLVSLMLAQASENPYISAIFDDLLDEAGSEFYIRPVTDYVSVDRPVNFYTIVEAARRRGEVAIGFRQQGKDTATGQPSGTDGVVVNPVKSAAVQYTEADHVIVLSEG